MLTIDSLIGSIDTALRSILPPKQRVSERKNPADSYLDVTLTSEEKRLVQGLMRVNHSGEVCAQALYQGQAATGRDPEVVLNMQTAAHEEIDHLAWCEARLHELSASPSIFNSVWYSASFLLGAFAGLCGDRVSLGFVLETERQVGEHLAAHLAKIPAHDQKTQAILTQMQTDEALHAQMASNAGGMELPFFIKLAMRYVARIMTWSSYRY